jgi:uncharacterized pyridoxal phosphate-containing UPF0001 family protein
VWETCSSEKTAAKVNRALEEARASTPLNVYLQINTSGEDSMQAAQGPGDGRPLTAAWALLSC